MSKNIAKVRETYSAVGPTSDNSSRVALMKKVQVRVSANKAKIFGLNGNVGDVNGTTGHSGQRTYFAAIFPRFSF